VTHLDLSSSPSGEQHELFDQWLADLRKNPQLRNENLDRFDAISESTKPFFQQVLNVAGATNLPPIQTKQFEPVLKFWHHLLTEYGQKGLTLKELALMVFSLKSTLVRWQEEHRSRDAVDTSDVWESVVEDDAEGSMDHLITVLDVLGVLTFEVFSRENEAVMFKQSPTLKSIGPVDSADGVKLVANSPQMQAVYKAIALVVENDITVLLEGETGTGKDVLASVIHHHSKRKKQPFITLNCGAIPKELLESELFGHERGAFTGADQRHIGKFELAHKGTLFLDEIGEMPLDLQVKLLRVLQNREVERVGGTEKVMVDVRIVAATNLDLKKEVDAGRFRKDLYYRIHVFPIRTPPLRARREDVLPLAIHFLQSAASRFQLTFAGLREDAESYLLAQPWDGNVRELENMMQRALVLAQGSPITTTILSMQPGAVGMPVQAFLPPPTTASLDDTEIIPLEVLERRAIADALQKTEGNVLQTAKKLGISRTTLYQKAKKYGIDIR
jgi:transcriptional regulator with GAF, ATPase, and Fis domain